jgi:dipeptidyl-peptidase-4
VTFEDDLIRTGRFGGAPAPDGEARVWRDLVADPGPYVLAGDPLPPARLRIGDVRIRLAGHLAGGGWDTHGPYAVILDRAQTTLRLHAIDPGTGATTVVHEQHGEPWVQVVPGLPARLASGAVVAHTDTPDARRLTVAGTPVTPPRLHLQSVDAIAGDEIAFTAGDRAWTYDGSLREHPRERSGRPILRFGNIRSALYLPAGHDGVTRLPVLIDSYGGPAHRRVTPQPDWHADLSQWFADQGFAVLVTDGRGTGGVSPAWEHAIHGKLYEPVLEDQITALHETAARRPFLDLSRVGIRGWSFAGSLALVAVLRRPDVFRVAVAGAPVTDQRRYHAINREKYLGHPARHPGAYDANDLIAAAPALTRPVLLMHGRDDRNVDPSHSRRFAAAAGIGVTEIPGCGHAVVGMPGGEGVLARELAFLAGYLG